MILKSVKIFFIIIGIIKVIPAISQNKYDYTWLTGIEKRDLYKQSKFEFQSDTLMVTLESLPFAFSEMNSCISDDDGNLLLYFNGCDIANGNHEILENGSGFNEGITGNWECPKNYGYPGPYQSALILPKPGNPHFHYLFYIRYDDLPTKVESSLLYAETDLTSGKGQVLYKDKHALTDSVVTLAGITAVKHANNQDWWLIIARRYTNGYARLLITAEGLVEYPDIFIGEDSIKSGGQSAFSPDGTKYMRYTPKGLLVMDFDRQEGQLSNVRFLSHIPGGFFFGGTFSPNGRFIYLSDHTKLYQVDTWNESLSLELVAEWDGYDYQGWRVLFGMMQTGPDCRIYVASLNCLNFVHIIMYPDEKGIACKVVQRALELKSSNCGFPHFPNFRLGTNDPYCDPNKVVITSNSYPTTYSRSEPAVFPNPTSGDFTISAEVEVENVIVYDPEGRLIFNQIVKSKEVEIPSNLWKSGVYFVRIQNSNKRQDVMKRLVIMK